MEDDVSYPYLEGRVEDVMTPNPVTACQDDSISDLVELFTRHHYHGVPVLGDKGELVGVARDSEILSMFARKEPVAFRSLTVADIMHYPPFVIGPGETIQKAVTKMFSDGTRFLVVVDGEGCVVGVVTRVDLIRGIRWKKGA